jgi:hypothetical protein
MECHRKPLSEFETWENEIYDSLYGCCSDKFPNSITSCCDTAGSGGCTLSGVVQWLPDWANGHCYEKVRPGATIKWRICFSEHPNNIFSIAHIGYDAH